MINRTIDTNSPESIPLLRIAGAVLFALQLALWAMVYQSIAAKKDKTIISVRPQELSATAQPGEPKNMTVGEFDHAKLMESAKGALFQGFFVAALHLYGGYGLPLILQPLMGLINAFSHRLVRIHILNNPTPEDLKRPWPKEPSL